MEKLIFSEQTEWKKKFLNGNGRRIFNFVNSHDVYHFVKTPLFKEAILKKNNVNFLDGGIVSFFFSIKNFKVISRLSGPDFTNLFFENINLSNKEKHFFIGLEQKELLLMIEKFPHLKISNLFQYNPLYIDGINFPEKEIEKMAKIINSKKINFVWVGLGCPKQNVLSDELFKKTRAKYFFNIGAGLDFVIGKKNRAPKFFRWTGLEWAYRLITDFNHSKNKVWRSFMGTFYIPFYSKLK